MEEELSGDVDFDFFEDGDKRSPTRTNSKSPVNGKPPIPSSSKSPANGRSSDKHGGERSPEDYSSDSSSSDKSYSSDYDSDDQKEKDGPKRVVTSVNARLPSADSGGRKNSPRARHVSRKKIGSDSDSTCSESDSENSERDSSSAYSDGKHDDDKDYQFSKHNDKVKPRAWETVNGSKTETSQNVTNSFSDTSKPLRESRPKSSYKRNLGARRRVSRSLSDSESDSNESESHTDSDSSVSSVSRNRKSGSDSEITDVSPLQSADSSPVLKRKNHKHVSVIRAPRKEQQPYKELPDTSENNAHRPPEGTMEFKLLMQAVAELDSEKQKRIKASTRRVVFAPPNQSFHREKTNYSFNDMQARNIDQENERLLQQIIRKRLPKKKREQTSQPVRRLPNSAVNRLKDQRRIERENLALLQRLQNIKPTRGLTKHEQLNEYRRNMQYGIPSSAGTWRSKHVQSPSSYMSNMRSMSSMSSNQSIVSSSASVGSASSRSRPHSAKKSVRDTRPAWEDRW